MRPKRILVLFPSLWDRRHFGQQQYRDRYDFVFYDRELWSFPGGLLRILRFDPVAYIERVVRDATRLRIDGVLSSDEYVGGVIAAAVAERLGLPGHHPATVIQTTHKYYARLAQQQITPELVPAFQLMPVPPPRADELTLPFPMFVKPVRGSFSIFAARCDDYAALRKHLALNAAWRFGIRSVLRPFNDLMRHFTGYRVDVNRFIGESFVPGQQVCVDGYVFDGEPTMMGVVDAKFFPGTHTFERFAYPSELPIEVQQRMQALCAQLIVGLGITHGQFNVEMVYNPDNGEIRIIEVHPRLSYQFADLYEDVDGINTYDILLQLTVGERPDAAVSRGRHNHAASLVIRKFEGRRLRTLPCNDSIRAFRERHPDARLQIFAKRGSMNPEMRAMGSYRCALINVGTRTRDELSAVRHDADAMLRFDVA